MSILKTIRKDYSRGELLESEISKNPMSEFEIWLDLAFKSGNDHANAMTLSTCDKINMPDSRIVLLRDISFGGFTFFTNYGSKKGKDIDVNSNASLLFFWPELERQIRIQGNVKFLPTKESDAYFESRPFESKVGALISSQSSVVNSRKEMEILFQNEFKNRKNTNIQRPDNWGGYVLVPRSFEFWQGRANRLHDRIRYTLNGSDKSWLIERLMP